MRLKRVATTGILLIAITGGFSGATAAANEQDPGGIQKEITPPSFMAVTSTANDQAPVDAPFAKHRQVPGPQESPSAVREPIQAVKYFLVDLGITV